MSDLADIALQRLASTRLRGKPFATPEEAVGWFGAVQSQDFPGAKWGIGQRIRGATDAEVHQAFQDGKILRTHIMRPTWHFVLPKDIRWLLTLTSPRVHAASAYYYRKEGLDDVTFARAAEVLAKVLQGNNYLTRTELGAALAAAGFDITGLRLAFIVSHAELDGLVCSGPMKGKQHTYALLDERAPKTKELSREESLAKLTLRYFTSHGPAQVHDFAWWSGLTVTDAKAGIELVKRQLTSHKAGDKMYWLVPASPAAQPKVPIVQLLPNYDEALVAYKDHTASLDPTIPVPINMLLNHLIVRNGQVVGGWRRLSGKNKVTVEANLPNPLDKAEFLALRSALVAFESFLGQPVELVQAHA